MKNPYILSLPIILATITGMLATDLYLPAVPMLHEAVGGTAVQAQYTLASFMAAFALGQLIVGSIGDRVETRKVMWISFAALTIVSMACAWVQDMGMLIFMRGLQGFAAAASVALAPAMIRELGDEMTAIKLIGFVSSVEAIVP
ncbi:MAG: MFS transporter, partial [Rhodospirillaceae bacterium]|nr:MFS transporter [Rhodospirillaceae bacterium]